MRVSPQLFALNIFSGTARPSALIFCMKHYLVNLYLVCSNSETGVHNASAAAESGLKIK